MKALYIIALLFAGIICASCNKTGLNAPAKTTGTWSVVSDSTFAAGIDAPDHQSTGYKYTGATGDYFTFTNNQVYIKESTVETDTATYTIANGTLKMVYAHLKEGIGTVTNATMTYLITNPDQHTLVLSSVNLLSPAGEFSEVITLTR